MAIEHGDFALPGQSEHSINRTLQIYQISTILSANFGGVKWKRPRSYPKKHLFPRPLWHRVLGLVPTCAPSTRGQAPMAMANMAVEILNNPHLSNMLTGKSHVNRGIVCWLPGEPMRHGPVSQDSKTARASSQRPPFPQALIKALKVMTSASSCSLSRERDSLKYGFGGAATPQRGCSHPNVRGGKRPKKVTKYHIVICPPLVAMIYL